VFASSSDGASVVDGVEADYCRPISASALMGDDDVDFVELSNATDGFLKLYNKDVDVVAGMSWNLQNNVREPTTGVGYTFSPPYFYSNAVESTAQDSLSLVTRQDDHLWSSFVGWIVEGSIYAEAYNHTQVEFNSMPLVDVFGPNFRRMFRNALLVSGNYGEIYDRNLEPYIPRSGRILLNGNPEQGPQHYAPPGFP